MTRSRRWPWLVAVAVLLLGAGWLMSQGDPPEKTPAVDKVKFPTALRAREYDRMLKRRTLQAALATALADAGAPPEPPARRKDPLLAALPPADAHKTAVVFEANALRNSPVGELLLDCLRKGSHGKDPFAQLKQRGGVDPLVDVDRIAMTSDGALISGNFQQATWDGVFQGMTRSDYGEHGAIYAPPGAGSEVAGVWNGQMLVIGKSVEDVQASLDRLEGRGEPSRPAVEEDESYGEIYGVLAPEDLAKMLGSDQKELAQKLTEVAQQVKLHVDAQSDVAMVADLSGPDEEKVTDLGKTLGGVLSLGRLKAQADGNDDLAELLDLARVTPEGGKFRAELALPMGFLEEKLAWCRTPEGADGGAR